MAMQSAERTQCGGGIKVTNARTKRQSIRGQTRQGIHPLSRDRAGTGIRAQGMEEGRERENVEPVGEGSVERGGEVDKMR